MVAPVWIFSLQAVVRVASRVIALGTPFCRLSITASALCSMDHWWSWMFCIFRFELNAKTLGKIVHYELEKLGLVSWLAQIFLRLFSNLAVHWNLPLASWEQYLYVCFCFMGNSSEHSFSWHLTMQVSTYNKKGRKCYQSPSCLGSQFSIKLSFETMQGFQSHSSTCIGAFYMYTFRRTSQPTSHGIWSWCTLGGDLKSQSVKYGRYFFCHFCKSKLRNFFLFGCRFHFESFSSTLHGDGVLSKLRVVRHLFATTQIYAWPIAGIAV